MWIGEGTGWRRSWNISNFFPREYRLTKTVWDVRANGPSPIC